jgi:hypothetical protein
VKPNARGDSHHSRDEHVRLLSHVENMPNERPNRRVYRTKRSALLDDAVALIGVDDT